MSAHSERSCRRNTLGFAEAVTKTIQPLLARQGLSCVEITDYVGKFESEAVVFAIYHDPVSYEIDVRYHRVVCPGERYNLSNMVEALIGRGRKVGTYFQASNHESVRESINAIAACLVQYGVPVLSGDVEAYKRIGEVARIRNEAYTKNIVLQPIRREADEAWRNGEYGRVQLLYERIECELTEKERKRLSFAKKRAQVQQRGS